MLKSRVISQVYDIYNYDLTYINKNDIESASCFEQAIFYMEDFQNLGKSNSALERLLPLATDALNKGGYFIVYDDKGYYKTLKYPRYNEETGEFELTDNQLWAWDLEYLPNGNVDDTLKPIITFFPFALTADIISNEDLELSYDVAKGIYNIKFSVNIEKIDPVWAEEYFDHLLNFRGGSLSSYSAEVEIWNSGMIKSISETHTWDLIYDTGIAGINLHMNMPLQGTTVFSYHPDDCNIADKLYLVS